MTTKVAKHLEREKEDNHMRKQTNSKGLIQKELG
jgi:hypothetical protein